MKVNRILSINELDNGEVDDNSLILTQSNGKNNNTTISQLIIHIKPARISEVESYCNNYFRN